MVEEFIIKLATMDDIKDVFELSNDEVVRQNSFTSETITWENHQKWFENKINDKNSIFYIVKDLKNNLISQIRFDNIKETECDVSICISTDFRNQGYGTKLLKECSTKIISEQKVKKINAKIKKENLASIKIFKQTGYNFRQEINGKLEFEFNAK